MYQWGECLVDPKTRRVSRGSQFVRLSPKAMGVLTALREAGGGVLTRGDLLAQVWPGVTVGEEVLTHAVAEIRRAFGDSIRQPRYLETVHKSGYRLLNVPSAAPAPSGVLDLDAYADYLDGCEMFFRGGPQNVRLAAEAFSTILEAHPHHTLAHAGLAKSLFFLDKYFGMPDGGAQIERCGQHAVSSDKASPEAHAALGLALSASGRYHEALASFAVSLRLNPHLSETHYLLGRTAFAKGDHRLSATMLERAAELRNDDFHSLLLAAKARRALGDEIGCRADVARASHRIDLHLAMYPDDRRALCDKICCMVELGAAPAGVDAALHVVHEANSSHYYLVGALTRAGVVDAALDCLATVMDAGWDHHAWLAHDRDVDPLRREPRFRRLAAEMRMP